MLVFECHLYLLHFPETFLLKWRPTRTRCKLAGLMWSAACLRSFQVCSAKKPHRADYFPALCEPVQWHFRCLNMSMRVPPQCCHVTKSRLGHSSEKGFEEWETPFRRSEWDKKKRPSTSWNHSFELIIQFLCRVCRSSPVWLFSTSWSRRWTPFPGCSTAWWSRGSRSNGYRRSCCSHSCHGNSSTRMPLATAEITMTSVSSLSRTFVYFTSEPI